MVPSWLPVDYTETRPVVTLTTSIHVGKRIRCCEELDRSGRLTHGGPASVRNRSL